MGDVVDIGGITKLDTPPEKILNSALGAELCGVVVMGYDADGEFYFASSMPDGGEVLWLAELMKKRLMEIADG